MRNEHHHPWELWLRPIMQLLKFMEILENFGTPRAPKMPKLGLSLIEFTYRVISILWLFFDPKDIENRLLWPLLGMWRNNLMQLGHANHWQRLWPAAQIGAHCKTGFRKKWPKASGMNPFWPCQHVWQWQLSHHQRNAIHSTLCWVIWDLKVEIALLTDWLIASSFMPLSFLCLCKLARFTLISSNALDWIAISLYYAFLFIIKFSFKGRNIRKKQSAGIRFESRVI